MMIIAYDVFVNVDFFGSILCGIGGVGAVSVWLRALREGIRGYHGWVTLLQITDSQMVMIPQTYSTSWPTQPPFYFY